MKNCPTWLFGIFATALLAVGCDDSDKAIDIPPTDFFSVEVTDVAATSARMTVTPLENETPYYCGTIRKSEFREDHGGDWQSYIDRLIAQLREESGKSVAETVSGIVVRGVKSSLLEALDAETEYVAFAMRLDTEGRIVGTTATDDFTTTKATTAGGFRIVVKDITAKSATMTITPDDLEAPYFYNIISKAIFEQSHGGNWQNYINNLIAHLREDTDKSVADVVSEIVVRGVEVYNSNTLNADTEYIAFAMGLNEQGRITLATVAETFTTPEIVSNNTFTVTFDNTSFDGTDFTITPENPDERYYYTSRAASYFADMTDEEMLETILTEDSFLIDFYATSGVTEYTNEQVDNTDTGYYVFVFGYDGGAPTTPLNKFAYRTSKGLGEPSACQFTIDVTNLKSRSAQVAITPSDKTQMFLWDILPESEYEVQKNRLGEFAAEYARLDFSSFGYGYERGDAGNMFSRNLEPGTKYYVWAACMDEFGQAAAEVIIPGDFTTLPVAESAADVTVTLDKYYDGDALFALDPETYATSKGYAFVPVTFAPNDQTTLWYANAYEDDLSNPADPTDEEIAEKLMASGLWCPVGKPFLCKWDEPTTILVLGIDSNDNYRITRIVRTFTKAGASPAEEYKPAENAVKPAHFPATRTPAPLRYRPVAER
ncbi:hypothetical protein [Alistipes sp.]|uniref:hypothetical protein n=1 Tax=Alistipes sp. TaxID=1872444 RepID=UPI0011C71FEE